MQTAFTDDQEALRESLRKFLARRSSMEVIRRAAKEVPGLPDYWSDLAGLDLLGIGLPGEDSGASGLVDIVPVYLELGRALAMTPHLETSIVAAYCLASLGKEPDHSPLVAALVAGKSVVIPALSQSEGEICLGEPGARADKGPDGWTLTGEMALVPYAHVAQHLLVVAATNEKDRMTAFLVPAGSAGLSIEHTPNIANLPLFRVVLKGVKVVDAQRVGSQGGALPVVRHALDRAAVLRCAEIAGMGERLLEMCIEYAKTREQFGKPIGSYQAVQYLCTDIAIATRVTLLLAVHAACLMDGGRPHGGVLAAARRYAKRAAAQITRSAHEVHAGVGFMDEHDLHLYTRRAKHWEYSLGNDDVNADEVISLYVS